MAAEYMWLDSVQSTLIDMAGRALASAGIRPGTSVQGTIEGAPGRLSLVVAGARVALPEDTVLTVGQRVQVDVTGSGAEVQLRVTQLPIGESGAAQPTPTPLESLVTRILQEFGVARLAESADQILPRALPQTDSAARAVLSLFAQQASTGDDLESLVAWISRAAADGALPAETAQSATALISGLLARDGDSLKPVVSEWGRAVPLEARIADAAAANNAQGLTESLRGDLRAVLSQLRNEAGLTRYLQDKGQLNAFHSAADRVIDRVFAGQLQNLHAIDQPYVFFEVPFASGGPVREARVHVFHEGHGARREHEVHTASVTLDLSTSKLGDLWITLQLANGNCVCRVAATSRSAMETIESARGELLNGLKMAGYDRASVHVDLWDGNRLRETAQLMRRFSGIDLKA